MEMYGYIYFGSTEYDIEVLYIKTYSTALCSSPYYFTDC